MSAGDVELVCFDLGRVLIRICDGWKDACAVAGIGADPAKLDAAQKLSLWELVLRSERGEIGLEEFAAGAAPILGLKPADVCALSDAYLRRTVSRCAGTAGRTAIARHEDGMSIKHEREPLADDDGSRL